MLRILPLAVIVSLFSLSLLLRFEPSFGLAATISVPDHDIIIIGGGITGLSTAAMLLHGEDNICMSNIEGKMKMNAVHPRQICILEKAKCIRPVGATIGLFPNGVTALESISPQLANDVCSSGIPYRGVIRHDVNTGEVTKNTLPSTGKGTYSVAWYILQEALFRMLPAGVVQFGKEVDSFTISNDKDECTFDSLISVTYRDRETHELERKTCRMLVGADGINSTVRNILFPEYKFMYNDKNDLGRKLFRAVISKEKLTENMDDEQIMYVLPPSGFTKTYVCRDTDRLFAMRQLADNVYSFTSSVSANEPIGQGIRGTSSEAKMQRLRRSFLHFPSTVQHWIQAVAKDAIYENDVYDIDMMTKWSRNNCVLIGDACHAMSPSLGQGGNVGLEDAAELGALLRPFLHHRDCDCECNKDKSCQGSTSIETALEKFEQLRMSRVKMIHDASRNRRNGNNLDASFRSWIYSWRPSFMFPDEK